MKFDQCIYITNEKEKKLLKNPTKNVVWELFPGSF